MDHTGRFSGRVQSYINSRPDYPSGLFDFLISETGLEQGSHIADIGSGTGISSRPFLERGMKVTGVEPNDEMREASAGILRSYNNFHAVSGTAEDTGLADRTADLVFCAQAFHWFNTERCLSEFKRILRPGSYVALVWNDRNTEGSEFSVEYEDFLRRFGTDYREVDHKRFDLETIRSLIPYPVRNKNFIHHQDLDQEGLLERVLSSSYMPSRESAVFPEMEDELNMLFYRHNFGRKVRIAYTTRLYYFQADGSRG